jgi:peptidylprolyl isomerase
MFNYRRPMLIVLGLVALIACGCGNADGEAANSSEKSAPVNEEVTLMTGLTIKDVVMGEGAEVKAGDLITVHYQGWVLNDGVKAEVPFDSSVERGEPVSFPIGVGRLIKGWDMGIPGMKVGSKRELTIAPELGYGSRGAGEVIPPDATLFFEVEVIAIPSVEINDTEIGTGALAETGDSVEVHYTGWLYVDGEKSGEPFDSSHNRGTPFGFQIGAQQVIAGWDQGVPGMMVGGKRTLIIPSELGYGTQGAGASIPPNATLLFEVELVAVAGK